MRVVDWKDKLGELDLLMELSIDKPLPYPLDGVVRVYQASNDTLVQMLVVDGEEKITVVELEGKPRVDFVLDIIEREGAEVLVSNAYIDRAVETRGAFDGKARLEAYDLPSARRALSIMTLTVSDDVLDELHEALVKAGSTAYPLSDRDSRSN